MLWLHLRALADQLDTKRPWPADRDCDETYDYSADEHQAVVEALRNAAVTLEALGNSE